MKKKARVSKSWSKRNLPDELWPEILSRLPVESLLRFRCVSRSWKIWIDDPNFTRLHLSRFNSRPHSPILFQFYRGQCVIKDSETLRTISSLGFLQSDRESVHVLKSGHSIRAVQWSVVSSVDGLFLLHANTDLMLWNPSIRKTLSLPPLPEIPLLHVNAENNINVGFGLGFDPLSRDYKAVKFVTLPTEDVLFAAVYTLKSNSWKLIECRREGRKDLAFYRWQSSVCFNGVLYGLAVDYLAHTLKLVSFDLRSEVFNSFGLPAATELISGSNYYLTMVDDWCSVALVHMSLSDGTIWTMERLGDVTETVNWTRRCTFDTVNQPSFKTFMCIKKNGEMLLRCYKRVECYNFETQEWKFLMEQNDKFFRASNYMESLILHNNTSDQFTDAVWNSSCQ